MRDDAPNTRRVRAGKARRLGLRPRKPRGRSPWQGRLRRLRAADGSVEDLYIDRHERDMCFLQMAAGGFLGIGEKNYLVLVEAITEVTEDRVTIELDKTK